MHHQEKQVHRLDCENLRRMDALKLVQQLNDVLD